VVAWDGRLPVLGRSEDGFVVALDALDDGAVWGAPLCPAVPVPSRVPLAGIGRSGAVATWGAYWVPGEGG
jgi:hypothetical protein